MKTILLNSPLFKERNPLYDEDSLPPLGLGYIATSLEAIGMKVELIDAVYKNIPLNELSVLINQASPAFLATNIFTTNYDLVHELCHSLNPKIKLIIGGLATKSLYPKILDWNCQNSIDVVIGDGELIVPKIVTETLEENPIEEIGNRRVFNVDGTSIYFVQDLSEQRLDRKFFENEPVNHPFGFFEANIVASRGCIYNCSFCAAARSLNQSTPIRERNVESLVCELQEIKTLYPKVTSIRVLDDLFLKNGKSIQTAIQVFSNFDFQWRSMAHVMTFNNASSDEVVALKNSGCKELFIGIESGSPKILKSIHKTHNIDQIVRNLTKLSQAQIGIKGYFIYGFPDESKEDMEMTFDLALRLGQIAKTYGADFRTSVFQYRPYHGTEIFHDLEERGKDVNSIPVEPNRELSKLVDRIQFNFHTVNHSLVDSPTLYDYIYRTINLNDPEIFSRKATA